MMRAAAEIRAPVQPEVFAAIAHLCAASAGAHGSCAPFAAMLAVLAQDDSGAAVNYRWMELFATDGSCRDLEGEPPSSEGQASSGITQALRTSVAVRRGLLCRLQMCVDAPTTSWAVVDAGFSAVVLRDHQLLAAVRSAAGACTDKFGVERDLRKHVSVALALTNSDVGLLEAEERPEEVHQVIDASIFTGRHARAQRRLATGSPVPGTADFDYVSVVASALCPRAVWTSVRSAMDDGILARLVEGVAKAGRQLKIAPTPLLVAAVLDNAVFVNSLVARLPADEAATVAFAAQIASFGVGPVFANAADAYDHRVKRHGERPTMASAPGDSDSERRAYVASVSLDMAGLNDVLRRCRGGRRGEHVVMWSIAGELLGKFALAPTGGSIESLWGPHVISSAIQMDNREILSAALVANSGTIFADALNQAARSVAVMEANSVSCSAAPPSASREAVFAATAATAAEASVERAAVAVRGAAILHGVPPSVLVNLLGTLPHVDVNAAPDNAKAPAGSNGRTTALVRDSDGARDDPWSLDNHVGFNSTPFGSAVARGFGKMAMLLLVVGDADGDGSDWRTPIEAAIESELELHRSHTFASSRDSDWAPLPASFECCFEEGATSVPWRRHPLLAYPAALASATRGGNVDVAMALLDRAMARRARLLEWLTDLDSAWRKLRSANAGEVRGFVSPVTLLACRLRRQLRSVVRHAAQTRPSDLPSPPSWDEAIGVARQPGGVASVTSRSHLCLGVQLALTILLPLLPSERSDEIDVMQSAILHAPAIAGPDGEWSHDFRLVDRVMELIESFAAAEEAADSVRRDLSASRVLVNPYRIHVCSHAATARWLGGLDINAMDMQGRSTVLLLAKCHVPALRRLAAVGACMNVAAKGPNGQSAKLPLHSAVANNLPDMARVLLELGTDPNSEDGQGRSALSRRTNASAETAAVIFASPGYRCVNLNDLQIACASGDPSIFAAACYRLCTPPQTYRWGREPYCAPSIHAVDTSLSAEAPQWVRELPSRVFRSRHVSALRADRLLLGGGASDTGLPLFAACARKANGTLFPSIADVWDVSASVLAAQHKATAERRACAPPR
jgi:hypothetical protein